MPPSAIKMANDKVSKAKVSTSQCFPPYIYCS